MSIFDGKIYHFNHIQLFKPKFPPNYTIHQWRITRLVNCLWKGHRYSRYPFALNDLGGASVICFNAFSHFYIRSGHYLLAYIPDVFYPVHSRDTHSSKAAAREFRFKPDYRILMQYHSWVIWSNKSTPVYNFYSVISSNSGYY